MTNSLLHIIGMFIMLIDHAWNTYMPWNNFMLCLGRLTFPIFAFLCAEGYRKTSNFKRHLKRMFIFALISEIPFDLMTNVVWFYPFHQNVMFNFCICLLMMKTMDMIKEKYSSYKRYLLMAGALGLYYILAIATFADYYGNGVLMVFVFYLFSGNDFKNRLGQFIGLYIVNVLLFNGLYLPITVFGYDIELTIQTFALLSLIFIWLYNGERGNHSKAFQYFCYLFYPAHMFILYLLYVFI